MNNFDLGFDIIDNELTEYEYNIKISRRNSEE